MEPELIPIAAHRAFAVAEEVLAGKLADVASACGFTALRISRDSRFAVAQRHVPGGGRPDVGSWNKELQLKLTWQPSPHGVNVLIAVYDTSVPGARLPESRIRDDVVNALTRLLGGQEPSPLETVLGPGEALAAAPRGPVRDYSHCAQENELSALFTGDLPLGYYAFGHTADQVKHGRPLFLSRFGKTGQPMIYNGVLVC